MHIADGFLSASVWAPAVVVSVAVVGRSVAKTRDELAERNVPLVGMMAAFVFAAQMINFPVAGGTSGHFMGACLAAIFLGPWAATLALAAVLVVQCLVFQDGGLLALGANVLNMAVIGVWGSWAVYMLIGRLAGAVRVGAVGRIQVFVASWVSIVMVAAACAIELAASGNVKASVVVPAMMGVHALIGIGEGLITLAVVEMVSKVRPDVAHMGGAVR